MALDRLIEKIAEKQNPTVAGLDPKLDYIPEHIKQAAFARFGKTMEGAAEAIWVYNRGLIDALCTAVPAVKPQAAYYEMYGWQGMQTLAKTVAYAQKKGMFVIMDGKRNDIGTTMQAYAAAHLGITEIDGEKFTAFGADALTVNGYLGSDGILPLTDVCRKMNKAIFVLVKTSNPSSGELQNLCLEGAESIYLRMGKMCEKWGEEIPGKYGYSGVGAVVGATYPQQLVDGNGQDGDVDQIEDPDGGDKRDLLLNKAHQRLQQRDPFLPAVIDGHSPAGPKPALWRQHVYLSYYTIFQTGWQHEFPVQE